MNLSSKIVIKPPKIIIGWRLLPWVLLLVTVGAIGVSVSSLPDLIPLYYSLPWGKDQLASKNELFLIPLITMMINIINSVLINKFENKTDVFLSRVLLISILICNLLGMITVLQIIRIVT